MRNISILGSTGSIGTQTLDVIRSNQDIRVVGLTAGRNIELLAQQIREFHPLFVSIQDENKIRDLKLLTGDLEYRIGCGLEGLIEAASLSEADIVLTAVVGMIGVLPTIEAIKAGHDIALANKETLVTAGHIIIPLAREKGVKILPVDSEHSAIFQCLNGESHSQIDKLLITASGGPFRGRDREYMRNVQLEDALKHPNWAMGQKITIDSATMVNKGLEVIEAMWLFDMKVDDIQVVVQPQSVIHSMIQFVDGSVIAQLGTPDMRLPIQYALYYPERRYLGGDRLDFAKLSSITFENPDLQNFSGLRLAFEAARKGGNMTTMLNAANEYAVGKFLKREIGFLDITDMIEKAMREISFIANPTIEEVLQTEQEVYELLRK